jgi:large subunit ribosomal protein L23
MTPENAMSIVLGYHSTERTFVMVEGESKICFIVDRYATKKEIAEAIKTLYDEDVVKINTARTVRGKKAFAKFKNSETASELATKMGML